MKKDELKILIIIVLASIIILGGYFLFFYNKNNDVITSIQFDKVSLNMRVGESEKLKISVFPNVIRSTGLIWESDNEAVVSVLNDGTVIANSAGSAVIKVSTEDGKISDQCLIMVKRALNEVIIVDKSEVELRVGEEVQLNVIVESTETTSETLIWTSENRNIVEVDDNGLITGVSEGETYVKVQGLNAEVECFVKVLELMKHTITYEPNGGSVTPTNMQIPDGTAIGSLPTPTQSGYKFLGWYTSKDGGIKVLESQIASSDMTLYAHWERIITVMTETYKVPNGYSVVGSYNSSTLKFKRIKMDNENRYYALIWVKDAYTQLNSSQYDYGNTRKSILNNEIKNYGYKNRGMIAVNGSYEISGRSNTPVVAVKGTLHVNDKFNTNYIYGTMTIGSDGWLKNKRLSNVNEAKAWLSSVGARNTWAITVFETKNWSGGTDGGPNHRTSICQIDENNFVLYVGYSKGIHDYMKELHDLFGCKIVVNLDGGGSSGIYYKTNTQSTIQEFYEYPIDRSRVLPDMLYFTE